jgi:hypothetical protein
VKPFKSGAIIAAWLLRVMFVWFVYEHYFRTFGGFDFKSFNFYLHVAYIIFGILLVAGGFMQKPGLTVLSGLVIFILPVVQLIRHFPENPASVVMIFLLPLAIGFFFFTAGNNN